MNITREGRLLRKRMFGMIVVVWTCTEIPERNSDEDQRPQHPQGNDRRDRQSTSPVRGDVGGSVVTASITNEAVADLELEKGKQAYAVIKASGVMVGID